MSFRDPQGDPLDSPRALFAYFRRAKKRIEHMSQQNHKQMQKCLEIGSKMEAKGDLGTLFFGFLGFLDFDAPLQYNRGSGGVGGSRGEPKTMKKQDLVKTHQKN